ncbi:helix-turn-helix transcriptional regulator [Pantoea cypripedii]|uniref:HTH luxR-type domain-containing protein n=1 Tax=Pantoea cypripedii TaxID=55209 RepID=A0A1X1EYB3_PANCY|nr:LuxR C-terminal-related transcriptional regulator [Pantoea cypripedii]MBP2195122.1 DNA-binding CsgD family transcriptional regulator [Pantoea cypripedii]ORM94961.1 hypothetical protein HA50_17060 [Pantoea cypripedii]
MISKKIKNLILPPSSCGVLFQRELNTHFGETLLTLAKQFENVEEIFGFIISDGKINPLVLSSIRDDSFQRVSIYLDKYSEHDQAITDIFLVRNNSGYIKIVPSQSILDKEYRLSCFDSCGFTDKITCLWRGDETFLVLNFYRSGINSLYNLKDEFITFCQISLSALWFKSNTLDSFVDNFDNNSPCNLIKKRLKDKFPKLSQREREVITLTLLGDKADKISLKLNISRSTVLTYRNRAYQRYNFTTANDFLRFIIYS